jgi:cyclic di-GMP phosphodiesterase
MFARFFALAPSSLFEAVPRRGVQRDSLPHRAAVNRESSRLGPRTMTTSTKGGNGNTRELPVTVYTLPAPAPRAPRLLVVDDEESIRMALSRVLQPNGFEVLTADSVSNALDLLQTTRFELVLCDVRMPGALGTDLVPQARMIDPDIAILMLSAVNDATTATQSLNDGAFGYIVKPFDIDELQEAIHRALYRRRLCMDQRRVEQFVREEVEARTIELDEERIAFRRASIEIAETLIKAMEEKDIFLRGHAQRVAELAASIAEELALDADMVEHIRLAGRLHDVGKIGIRESVLNKPGKLTSEEYEHVKDHVRIGLEILSPLLSHLGPVLDYIRDHHEHWDGSGYPRRLGGEDISLGGRILTAADAFDALISRRAYRDGVEAYVAMQVLEQTVGQLLDPRVFATLKVVVERNQSLIFIE